MPKDNKNCSLMAPSKGKCLQTGDKGNSSTFSDDACPPHLLLWNVGCHGDQHGGKDEKYRNVKSVQAIYTFGKIFSLKLNLNCFTIFPIMLNNIRP